MSVRNSPKPIRPAIRIALATLTACFVLAAGAAQARGLTRQQVLADLEHARTLGDLIEAGELAQPMRERSPGLYPPRKRASTTTRAQVLAQLATARAHGDLQSPGDDGRTLREQSPGAYPSPTVAPMLTRQQVLADLEAARRSGDLLAGGESGLKQRELRPDLYPGQEGTMTGASTASTDARSPVLGHRSEPVRTAS